jgi:hypothetical protein
MRDPRAMLTSAFVLAILLGGAAPPHGPQPCLHGPFAGITATSATGEIIGTPDAQDWGCVPDRGSAQATPAGGLPASLGFHPPAPPPSGVCLQAAYPNPTTDVTHLGFSLSQASHVSLVVYGRARQQGPHEAFPARILVDADLAAGLHQVLWDGNDAGGVRVPAGVYRAVLVVGDHALCGDIEIR